MGGLWPRDTAPAVVARAWSSRSIFCRPGDDHDIPFDTHYLAIAEQVHKRFAGFAPGQHTGVLPGIAWWLGAIPAFFYGQPVSATDEQATSGGYNSCHLRAPRR